MSWLSFLSQTSCSFEGEKTYENVIVLLRRHWIVLISKLVLLFIVGIAPIVAWFFFPHNNVFYFASGVFYLIFWYVVFYIITRYLLDIWIVTDHRIIDSEQHGFFNHSTAEIHLSKIQDISVVIRGVIPTFFDYGTLEVQSAGATEKFFFKQIPHPNQIRELIMQAHNRFIETHPNDVEVH